MRAISSLPRVYLAALRNWPLVSFVIYLLWTNAGCRRRTRHSRLPAEHLLHRSKPPQVALHSSIRMWLKLQHGDGESVQSLWLNVVIERDWMHWFNFVQNVKHSSSGLSGKVNRRLDRLVVVICNFIAHQSDKFAMEQAIGTVQSKRQAINNAFHREADPSIYKLLSYWFFKSF